MALLIINDRPLGNDVFPAHVDVFKHFYSAGRL